MDEIELESPKASPAETLRAYSFFYSETTLGREAFSFVAVQIILISVYLLTSFSQSQNTELQSIISNIHFCVFWAGVYFAIAKIRDAYKRHCRRQRLRISVWEHEIKTFCAKRGTIVLAALPPPVALAVWLTLFFIRRPL
ncbi:MAG TPA: hypothetical protein VM163_00055 [bacterium]|nr:hypothetical protein [bacterium]